ncbi:VOC family protein [Bacillus sp. CH30_1T]|uniref:VOC family protein n=1 Tax=Bacillus sp. CH30_1T TaxID=2604836 RepID=UPI0011EF118D|nr:VOC family protein [Bacillus sp. CH30_1T]KAA0562239.1 VOC family protein [Bacillus sp. CH30_1T]
MKKNTGVTFQVRISDFEVGMKWYKKLFNRKPDFVAHEDFAEWEIIPNTWFQVAKGQPTIGNGPLRLGVEDIKAERERLMEVLNLKIEEINTREGVPAAWCSFEDLYGNKIGLYQEL